MLVFLLCVGKDVCLVKQMAMERAREREKEVWRSLYFMSLQIGALGSSRSRSYIHGSGSISQPFSDAPLSWNPQLRMFLFACVTGHELAYGCAYVSSLGREGRERKKKWERGEARCTEESLYVSPNWNTWLQIVGLFLMPPGCQLRLLSHCTWKVSALGFPLPVCSYWDMTECFRMHASCCWWQGDTLSGSDCPSFVQSRRLDSGRWHISWIINNRTHFDD